MKTNTKLAIAVIAAAVITTTGAFANDLERAAFDTRHGSVTYFRPVQKQTTVAVYAHGKGIVRADGKAKSDERRLNKIATSHGAVSYFAPVE
jgi:hypothetical protein